jgi:TonB family protein
MSMRGHVVITFNVHKDGTITELTVVGPSSIDVFNKAAIGALLGSNPTQAIPPEYPAEQARFTVTFFYNESPDQATGTSVSSNKPTLPLPAGPLPNELGSSLLNASAVNVEQRIGKPSQVDGHRWTYNTPRGTLVVYFEDAQVVIDVQPGAFDLSVFKK